MLDGKKIILGITGSIAAYKAAFLCRLLIKSGCKVRVVMTPSAVDFISPLTMSTLSGNDVFIDISDGDGWNNHVELGLWGDVFLVAPCTASTLAKMASGISDNLLVACYLSAKCPVMVAPAMDLDMWKHPSTQNNIKLLQSYENFIIPVGIGFLASGLEGEGRMAEPEDILTYLNIFFSKAEDIKGKHVLITAGPTYEAIDPVRFIGNRSSGKMGYSIAKECKARGAQVTLVSGPVSSDLKADDGIEVVRVQSAEEMYHACDQFFENADIVILAAAVADYRPAEVALQKIKKSDDEMQISLKKTIDIAATLGAKKKTNQIFIGFALETNDEINHATKKLHKKNLDFIVLNTLNDKGAGFQVDTNKITILDNKGMTTAYDLKSKTEVAQDIVDYLVIHYLPANE
ncbi:MAG: bifunctional phosphopantothenoylcysteine decarboxylase/phosphopantothenate--cysteine ligase CoaBC [Saprospiraceae bacterium]|nr:bifunctional phosphopantothenoylcysteine decarboxylase/phosphopantothenate--cysteine ligase CoaBC [Saprospiraceae bacterium]